MTRRNDTFIGCAHRARLRRMEKGKAIKATAHHLARLIYAMLTQQTAYQEKTLADFDEIHRARAERRLHREAARLGMTVQKSNLAPAPQNPSNKNNALGVV